jgi:hypothetical protein
MSSMFDIPRGTHYMFLHISELTANPKCIYTSAKKFPNLIDEEESLSSKWLSPRYSRIYLLCIESEWIITIGSEASQHCPFCSQSVGRLGYALQRPQITFRFPAGARSFYLLQRIQIGAGTHSDLLFKGNVNCSPREWSGCCLQMTTNILLMSGLRMLEGIATLLHRLHGVVFNTTGGQLRLTLKQTLISQ